MRLLYFPVVETARFASIDDFVAAAGEDRAVFDRRALQAAAEPCDVVIDYDVIFDDPAKQWRPAAIPLADGTVVAGVAMLGEGRADLAEVELFVESCFRSDPEIAGVVVHIRALLLERESPLQ